MDNMPTFVAILEGDNNTDLVLQIRAENKELACEEVESKLQGLKGYTLSSIRAKWGGHRPGAGRPKGLGKYGCTTKVVRVPESLSNDIHKVLDEREAVMDILEEWKKSITEKRRNSPRWKYVADLLQELSDVITVKTRVKKE